MLRKRKRVELGRSKPSCNSEGKQGALEELVHVVPYNLQNNLGILFATENISERSKMMF